MEKLYNYDLDKKCRSSLMDFNHSDIDGTIIQRKPGLKMKWMIIKHTFLFNFVRLCGV